MDAVSYPEDAAGELIAARFVPLRLDPDSQLAEDFTVRWTPSLFILDDQGKEHHRSVGFLEAGELAAFLHLGEGNLHFNHKRWKQAAACYEELLEKYPRSSLAPEAVFQLGVARFREGHDIKNLKDLYARLDKEYPGCLCHKKAWPYSLLPDQL